MKNTYSFVTPNNEKKNFYAFRQHKDRKQLSL